MKNNSSVFQVNLEGVLRILSESLYSTHNIFIRELLQNSVDAITARKKTDQFDPLIEIVYFSNENGSQGLIFSDNGVGLTEEEVELFLSKIGASSKSVDSMIEDRSTYIGQFGIGMLSCFMVSDEILVKTRSAKAGSKTVKWVGKIDGTYSTGSVDEQHPIGTSVILTINEDVEFDSEVLFGLLKDYSTFITTPVHLEIDGRKRELKKEHFSWEHKEQEAESRIQGKQFFNEHFEWSFPIAIPEIDTFGRAYIINRTTHYGEQAITRVYIKNMFISKDNRDILPSWAFFVRLVINSGTLSPTASREDIFRNNKLTLVQKAIEKAIKDHIQTLSTDYPEILEDILRHHIIAFKSLAIEDPEFGALVIPKFLFSTSRGTMDLEQIMKHNKTILYIPDVDEYNRILPIAKANDKLIVNAGYIYDAELFDQLADKNHNHLFQRINSAYFGSSLKDVDYETDEDNKFAVAQLQKIASEYDCNLSLKIFEPFSVPALFYMSHDAYKSKDSSRIKEESSDLWAFVTDSVSNTNQNLKNSDLYLNAKNEVIIRLLEQPGAEASRIILETLLFNAMLQGNIPLSNTEQQRLNSNLLYLLQQLK
jgi:molecular chaperone HtpG